MSRRGTERAAWYAHPMARSEVTTRPAVAGNASQAARRQRIVDAALELLQDRPYDQIQIRDVAERAGDALGTLSKGQRQRVAWVEANLGAPPVLLLDEPAAGLDEEERAAVRDRLAAGRGARTVVWASHELADVEAVADRIVVMVGGAVAAAGPLAALRAAAGVDAGAGLRAVVAALGARA